METKMPWEKDPDGYWEKLRKQADGYIKLYEQTKEFKVDIISCGRCGRPSDHFTPEKDCFRCVQEDSMNKWIVEATGKLEKLIDKELEVYMGEKKFGRGTIVEITVGQFKGEKGIVFDEGNWYRNVWLFDKRRVIHPGINCIKEITLEPKLSREKLMELFDYYCSNGKTDKCHPNCRFSIGEKHCKRMAVINHQDHIDFLTSYKSQKEQEKKEEVSWKCSNQICDSKEVGKSKHFCKKCGCLLVKPIARGELERDRTVKIEMKFCEEVYSALVDIELAPPKEVLLVKQEGSK